MIIFKPFHLLPGRWNENDGTPVVFSRELVEFGKTGAIPATDWPVDNLWISVEFGEFEVRQNAAPLGVIK